jgi:hypothetical protein
MIFIGLPSVIHLRADTKQNLLRSLIILFITQMKIHFHLQNE